MREVFKKMIERMNAIPTEGFVGTYGDHELVSSVIDSCAEVVESAISDYCEGWISVNKRPPEDRADSLADCFLITDGFNIWMAYYNSEIGWQFAECTNAKRKIDWCEIIAWQPLPKEPHKIIEF